MAKLQKIVSFLDKYLEIYSVKDSCWNGLQYEGKEDVERIAFAVDAGIETFLKAASLKCDMVVVHHGHFWTNMNPSCKGWSKKRLDILHDNDISLYACHLPLDRHKIVGNNAQIIKLLGGKIENEFLFHSGTNIGWTGRLKKSKTVQEITGILEKKLNSNPNVLSFGPKKVNTVAVCSGGGGYGGFYEALEMGVDLYLTGDAIEVFYTAKDAEMNVIFAGHHATETIGLTALQKVVDKQMKTDSVFIDLPTGL